MNERTHRTGTVRNGLTVTRCNATPIQGLCAPFIGGRACMFCPRYLNHTNDHAAGTVTVTCNGRVL